jgi:DNA-binding response OmpR family regulator
VLEVSLRKAGFTVTPAVSVKDALDKLELHTPDLIISETKFPELDGFELRRRLRASTEWAEIPFVFLTSETAIENKIRGLELGVEDYLTKPIYIKEIVTRINILLQKKQRAGFEERKDGVRFAGRVADMPVVDVIQTIEISRKSGVIHFTGMHGRTAAIYFRDGRVIDAEAGTLQGEDAVYRLLTWGEGEFQVEFRTVRRREAITTSSQGLLMEGMRRLDEWTRLLEQLPPLIHRFEVDSNELALRLGDIPDEHNRILRLFDGKRTLLAVIDASDFGDLECLQAISRLYFEGLLLDLDPEERPKRDTGRPMPLVVIDEGPTPIEEVASGPIQVDDALDEPSEAATFTASSTQPIVNEDVLEEEDVPGPLLGGYRPSSLRLIDEAVAAAQAIEPSLFEPEELAAAGVTAAAPVAAASSADSGPATLAKVKLATRETDPRVRAARDLVEKLPSHTADRDERTNGTAKPSVARETELEAPDPAELAADAAIPTAIEADEPPLPYDDFEANEPEPRKFAATIRRDDSGMRMIGSHGRDRAEASGELRMPAGALGFDREEPQRELVTIMPRRRDTPTEMQAVAPPVEAPPVPKSAPPVAKPEPPKPPPIPPAKPRTPAPAPRTRGPGPGASVMLVLATLLAGVSAYMYCSKTRSHAVRAAQRDAGTEQVITPAPADAAPVVVAPPPVDAGHVASTPPDAAVVATARDASVPADAPVDRVKMAKDLYDKATSALEDGDAEQALTFADQSLKYRRTARTLLERARALQRLDRIDEALKSVDEAIEMQPSYGPSYEARALILWSARRYDEAKQAMKKYIEVQPDGRSVEAFKHLIEEQQ